MAIDANGNEFTNIISGRVKYDMDVLGGLELLDVPEPDYVPDLDEIP